ncbi:hypothetical protein [Paracoccus sp. S-4012]|uniref:hypothetical protein n=1 Tax=Paracoccus sp. S-4012 TaxID=2665648 RepID=UPI001E5ACC75|nr:hypothetical protein [Paracoccus sp. S-4012]
MGSAQRIRGLGEAWSDAEDRELRAALDMVERRVDHVDLALAANAEPIAPARVRESGGIDDGQKATGNGKVLLHGQDKAPRAAGQGQ